jgi:hypothetical protein
MEPIRPQVDADINGQQLYIGLDGIEEAITRPGL